MFGKLQILCLVFFCCCNIQVKAQRIRENKVLPKFVIENCYFEEVYYDYLILSTYIVNNSNDTLKYWDTSGQLGELFVFSGKVDLQLISDVNTSPVKLVVLAPHSSKHIELKFLAYPFLRSEHVFKVIMKYHPWFETSNFDQDRMYMDVRILTDSIKVVFDGYGGGSYLPQAEWVERKKSINPSKSLSDTSLINNQTDTLTVDQREITKTRVYTRFWHEEIKLRASPRFDQEETYFLVPVTIHNNGDNQLSYDTMSCMWEDDYRINNEKLRILLRSCDKNIPITIEVPPHSTRTQTVTIVFAKEVPFRPQFTKIGLKIRGGVIWSNEIRLKTD